MSVVSFCRNISAVFCLFALSVGANAQESSLQDIAKSVKTAPAITIYQAKQIVTLDPKKPSVTAVAVVGDRILATGSVAELKAATKGQPYTVNTTFANSVIVPGLIAQHDHPLLAALTMTADIIAIEDWVLPDGTRKAAKDRADYLAKLKALVAKSPNSKELVLTWGWHHYFHGKLTAADLDKISTTRPILVWHRSCHEVVLNGAAQKKFGVTKAWFDTMSRSQKAQANFADGHYYEQGLFGLLPKIASVIAPPERLQKGLKFVEEYFHANGVVLGCEPGGIVSKSAQDAQNSVMSASTNPLRWYFIADGKSIVDANKDSKVISETEKLLGWGSGMTAYIPKQVKLFSDGAIFSQLMQMRQPYMDGHAGEWMMDKDFFARSFRIYWDAGYQLHIHVNGDAGLDFVLDQLELNLRRKPRRDHRTVIIHFAVSTPQQVARIKKLGAIVSGNPYYPVALADNYATNGLGPRRADPMVRMGDVERAGISYSFHSDMPMAPGQPLFLMWCAVNRVTGSGRVAAPAQRVSRLGALKAVTIDAAYSLQMENETGSIESGKLANFTVLNDNPVTCPPMKIKDIKVWGTVQEGRVLPVKSHTPAKSTAGMSRIQGVALTEAALAQLKQSILLHASH